MFNPIDSEICLADGPNRDRKGKVEYVNSATGCGFIAADRTAKDVLFLPSAVTGPVPELGQEDPFEIAQTTAGPRARKMQKI
jgi:cold shock CspA family protein